MLNQDTRECWNVHSERFHLIKIFSMNIWMCNSIMEIIIIRMKNLFGSVFMSGECGLKWAVIQFCGTTFGSWILDEIENFSKHDFFFQKFGLHP